MSEIPAELTGLRASIDNLDQALVCLLAERFRITQEVGRLNRTADTDGGDIEKRALSDHAGVYIGNGYFIHASSGGHRVVVSNLLSGSYYNRVFSWGRRILN